MRSSRYFTLNSLSSVLALSCSLFAASSMAIADGGPRGSIKDAPVGPPPFTWTGFYAGLNAGMAWSEVDHSRSGVNTAYVAAAPNWNAMIADRPSADDNGFVGGLQLGYNHQSGRLVYGLEADINFMRTRASTSRVYAAIVGNDFFTTDRLETDWLITLRPRLGVTMGTTMFYVTGGLALTEMKTTHAYRDSIAPIFVENTSASDLKAGWTIGGGAETSLGGKWSLKAEYLYVDFGSIKSTGTLIDTATGVAALPATTIHNHNVDLSLHTVRLGLNYKF